MTRQPCKATSVRVLNGILLTDKRLSLLGANVLIENNDYGKMLDLARHQDTDIILLTEGDKAWEEAMRPLQEAYPYRIAVPLENSYGMHLYSRLPMSGEVKYRVQEDIPSIDARITMRDGSEVILFAIHPEPPRPGDDSGERTVGICQQLTRAVDRRPEHSEHQTMRRLERSQATRSRLD